MKHLRIVSNKKESLKQVFGTQEWASKTVNIQSGCSNDCKYCYAKSMAVRFKRKTVENWKEEDVDYKKVRRNCKKVDGYVMYPSTHDLSLSNTIASIDTIENILKSGNSILIVTKPVLAVIKILCHRFWHHKDRILFRFTIGSTNSETLKFWEPYAPNFEERFKSLQYAYSFGFNTSISAEPVLDSNTQELINTLSPYVTDAIWVGLPNKLKARLKMNGETDAETMKMADDLIEIQSVDWVVNLYETNKHNPQIKWKESIKKIVGLKISTESGLDV